MNGGTVAIKGKGRTKSKQIARAPKPVAVPVKPPFFLRRWVQLTLTFAGGVGLVAFVVWFANGLREEREREAERAAARDRGAVVRQYQARVEAALQPVGQAQPPTGFAALPELTAGLEGLRSGDTEPEDVRDAARAAARTATRAAETLEEMDVDDLIRDQGFARYVVSLFLSSQRRMVQGLRLYAEAARAVVEAAGADGPARDELVGVATGVADLAGEVFQDGYRDYQEVLFSAEIFAAPQLPGPGDQAGG